MTRAHLSSLTAWWPLPTCVVVPLPPINRRAADSESNDGLVLPLRNGTLPALFCPNEDWNTRCHLDILLYHDGERSWMPNNLLSDKYVAISNIAGYSDKILYACA